MASQAPALPVKRALSRDDVLMRVVVALVVAGLAVMVALPLWWLLSKSFENADGQFVGLANYVRYFSTPALFESVWNSLFVALVTTAIVLPLAFIYAYALTRAVLPMKPLFQALALIPILAPSLLPAISLIYMFGNQGIFRDLLMGPNDNNSPIYGPLGIVVAQVFYCFPHALMILVTALATADARLYEAADALGTAKRRVFFTVTLPGAKYGVIGAGFVVFTLVITDFGVAKVIGGRFNVLATDVYKQVIGQQNFEMGAVVGMILLVPAVLAFFVDRVVQRRQTALLTARAVPLVPKPQTLRDIGLAVYCAVIGLLILGVLLVAVWASFIQYWPYNMSLSLRHYAFENYISAGWGAYWNSLIMAAWAATLGTALIFVGAYAVEKCRGFAFGRGLAQFFAMLPMAVPGLVLGLAYIFFFNDPRNPLTFIYATMAILVVNTIGHLYTVCHLTATTALKQIDAEFESVSASLKVPFWRTFLRVTTPICAPAILDIWMYMFLNAMTTVSAVIFLYGSDTMLASIAIVQMEEAASPAGAAAMATMIVITSLGVKVIHAGLERVLLAYLQRWRRR